MSREVTGYYHASIWRYQSQIHCIKVIAPDRTQAAEAVEMFLTQRGYFGQSVENIARELRQTRSISGGNTVIVADFHNAQE